MKLERWMAGFLVVAMTFPGCSFFRSSTQILSITSDQPDAEIFVNGSMVGKGAVALPVKRNETVRVRVKKEGYITAQRLIENSLNTTGTLDLCGGCIILLPILGFLSPGAFSLDEENVKITMAKS